MRSTFLVGVLLVACGGSTSDTDGDGKPITGNGGSAGSGAIGGNTVGGNPGIGGNAVGGNAAVGGSTAGTGNTAGAAAAGGYVADGGLATCEQIKSDFDAALAEAKTCDPTSASACQLPVDTSAAGCGYYAFVDASNTDAIAELDALHGDFDSNGCQGTVSCALGGWGPYSVKCVPDGSGGTSGICKKE